MADLLGALDSGNGGEQKCIADDSVISTRLRNRTSFVF
jgi:hypothetical protein